MILPALVRTVKKALIMNDMHKPYVTVTHGIRGYFAVMLVWNEAGFYEPWNSSPVTCATRAAAVTDGKFWADSEGVEFK